MRPVALHQYLKDQSVYKEMQNYDKQNKCRSSSIRNVNNNFQSDFNQLENFAKGVSASDAQSAVFSEIKEEGTPFSPEPLPLKAILALQRD